MHKRGSHRDRGECTAFVDIDRHTRARAGVLMTAPLATAIAAAVAAAVVVARAEYHDQRNTHMTHAQTPVGFV